MLGASMSKSRGQINQAGWRVMLGNGYFRLVLRCSSGGLRPEGREGEGSQAACGKGPWQSEFQDSEMGGCLGDLEEGKKLSWVWSQQTNRGEGCRRQREKCIWGPDTTCTLGKFFFFLHSILSEIGSHGGGYFSFFCTMQLSSHKSMEER